VLIGRITGGELVLGLRVGLPGGSRKMPDIGSASVGGTKY